MYIFQYYGKFTNYLRCRLIEHLYCSFLFVMHFTIMRMFFLQDVSISDSDNTTPKDKAFEEEFVTHIFQLRIQY